MNTEGFEQWAKLNKSWANPWAEMNKATTELCRKMTQQHMELIGENFSRMTDQLKRLSNVKKPEDMLSLQKECINEDITASIETMQKLIHTTMENMEEFTKLCGTLHTTGTCASASKTSERERSGK